MLSATCTSIIKSRVSIGEIKYRYFYDQRRRLKNFARYIGPDERASDIPTIQVQNYRQKLIKEGKAATTAVTTSAL